MKYWLIPSALVLLLLPGISAAITAPHDQSLRMPANSAYKVLPKVPQVISSINHGYALPHSPLSWQDVAKLKTESFANGNPHI